MRSIALLKGPRGLTFHQEMDVRFADLLKTMASVQRADRVPLEVSQAHREPHLISNRQAMSEDCRSEPLALIRGKQVEVVEEDVIRLPGESNGAHRHVVVKDAEERLLPKPLLMKRPLKILIPPPAGCDVGSHGCAFHIERVVERLPRVRETLEPKVRRQIRKVQSGCTFRHERLRIQTHACDSGSE